MKKEASATIIALLLLDMLSLTIGIQPAKSDYKTDANIASLPSIDWTHYHNYTEVTTILLALNETYPDIVDVSSIGKSWQNRDIYCVRLTNESDLTPKPEIFFVGYHHAREPVTAELTLYFLIHATTNYGANTTITEVINRCEIYVVPALDVDGFDLFEVNDWQRKNARPTNEDGDVYVDEDPPEDEDGDGLIESLWNLTSGEFIRWEGVDNDGDGINAEDWIGGVDLNRNYNHTWQSGSTNPRSEIYKGPAPFSEPETQAIRDLVQRHNFTYAITYHSGIELILYPWGCTYDPPPDEAKFIQIAQDLSTLTGGTPYDQAIGLYPSYGTIDDWMYATNGTFILTCEIFENATFYVTHPGPDPDTQWEGFLRYSFNPFPQNIETTLLRWLPTFYYLTNRAVSETSAHDIALTNIQTSKTVIGQGYMAKINVTVRNKGAFPETFNVTVYANTTLLATVQNINLLGFASTTLTVTWDATSFSRGIYTISANATHVLNETYTIDNTLNDGTVKVTIPGDINGDFFVNIQDATQIGLYWMQTVPPAPANADINGDGIINIKDATIIGTNWLKP